MIVKLGQEVLAFERRMIVDTIIDDALNGGSEQSAIVGRFWIKSRREYSKTKRWIAIHNVQELIL